MMDDVRVCPRCLLDKPISQFRGPKFTALHHRWCFDCRSVTNKGAHLRVVTRSILNRQAGMPGYRYRDLSNVGDIIEGKFASSLADVFDQLARMGMSRADGQ